MHNRKQCLLLQPQINGKRSQKNKIKKYRKKFAELKISFTFAPSKNDNSFLENKIHEFIDNIEEVKGLKN